MPNPAPSPFRRLTRLFWLVWIALPFMVLQDFGFRPTQLIAGDLAAPDWLADLVDQVPAWGQAMFWADRLGNYLVLSACLAAAHWIIHRAAQGPVFVPAILRLLPVLGAVLLAWPLISLVLDNLFVLALAQTAGSGPFEPRYLPDVMIMGFGLFLLAVAAAFRQAKALSDDADLTI